MTRLDELEWGQGRPGMGTGQTGVSEVHMET